MKSEAPTTPQSPNSIKKSDNVKQELPNSLLPHLLPASSSAPTTSAAVNGGSGVMTNHITPNQVAGMDENLEVNIKRLVYYHNPSGMQFFCCFVSH